MLNLDREILNIKKFILSLKSEYYKNTSQQNLFEEKMGYSYDEFESLFNGYLDKLLYGDYKTKGMKFFIEKGMYNKAKDILDKININILKEVDKFISIFSDERNKFMNFPSKEDVDRVVEKVNSITNRLMVSRIPQYSNKIDEMYSEFIGQENAITSIKNLLVKRNFEVAIGMKPRVLPILLVGPVGTGKTQACKKVAKLLYGKESALFRIDLNNFRDDHDALDYIYGIPSDDEEKSEFVEHLSRNLEGIILIDNLDKADYVFKATLHSMLDNNEFIDNKGKKYDLSKYIIFASVTPNRDNDYDDIFGVKNKDNSTDLVESLNIELGHPLMSKFKNVIEFVSLTKEAAKELTKLKFTKMLNQRIEKTNERLQVNINLNYYPNIDAVANDIVELDDEYTRMGGPALSKHVNEIWEKIIPVLSEEIYKNCDKAININVGVVDKNIVVSSEDISLRIRK